MTIDVNRLKDEELPSELQLGAFMFERELSGRIVLHVDADSGLFPLRLTEKQAQLLKRWLLAYETHEQFE